MFMKLIVGVCGASGINYAVALLRALKEAKVETHLIISEWAERVAKEECEIGLNEIKKLATKCYDNNDMAAAAASSSFLVDGMVIIPATVKTVSEIATAHCGTLIAKAADNMLRMKRKLVLCVRETPLSVPAIECLYKTAVAGAVVMPLSPAFYHRPKNINGLEDFIVGKVMDLFGLENSRFKRWKSEP